MARMTKKMQHGLNNNYLKLMGTRVNICKQFCIPASCTSAESFQQHVTTELRPQQVKKGIKRKNVMDSWPIKYKAQPVSQLRAEVNT